MVINDVENCTGCGGCTIICPSNCLTMELSREGFYVPRLKVNSNCIECNLCNNICPQLKNETRSNKFIGSYSYINKDEKVLNECTSGGAGYDIAMHLMNKGYKVCGVVYNSEKERAEHKICINDSEIKETRGSKYIQSYSVDAFSKLFNNDNYVVFGTPCQIDSLNNILKLRKKRDKFILVDYFCHGVPSYLLWNKYLDHVKKNLNIKKVHNVKFRNKIEGWHKFTMKFSTEKGDYYSTGKKDSGLFFKFFLGNFCLNNCCFKCQYRLTNSAADIRIGDLWSSKYFENNSGVSGIITFTDAGKRIVDELNNYGYIRDESVDTVLEGQVSDDIKVPNLKKIIDKFINKKVTLKFLYLFVRLLGIKNKIKRILSRR